MLNRLHQFGSVPTPLAPMIFQVMCLIKNNTFPFKREQRFQMLTENLIVDDNPVLETIWRERRGDQRWQVRLSEEQVESRETNSV